MNSFFKKWRKNGENGKNGDQKATKKQDKSGGRNKGEKRKQNK